MTLKGQSMSYGLLLNISAKPFLAIAFLNHTQVFFFIKVIHFKIYKIHFQNQKKRKID